MQAVTLLYAVVGTLTLVGGVAGIVAPQISLPADAGALARHLVREQAAGFVLIGMLLLWAIRRTELRRPLHIAMLLFTGLFAAIHWREYVVGASGLTSPAVNTVPVAMFAATLRKARERE